MGSDALTPPPKPTEESPGHSQRSSLAGQSSPVTSAQETPHSGASLTLRPQLARCLLDGGVAVALERWLRLATLSVDSCDVEERRDKSQARGNQLTSQVVRPTVTCVVVLDAVVIVHKVPAASTVAGGAAAQPKRSFGWSISCEISFFGSRKRSVWRYHRRVHRRRLRLP